MEAFVAEFGKKLNRAEVQWLQNLYRFTDENLLSISEVPDITCRELSLCIFQCLRRICHHSSNPSCHQDKTGFLLPLRYRFISIRELSRQKTQCCSCVAWSTNQFKEWTQRGEIVPANCEAISRTNLLLCGILTDNICIPPNMSETATQQHDGHLYFRDKNDILHCEVTKLDRRWLDHLVLFPRWSYIPQTKTVEKLDGAKTGYLEIPEAPFFLLPNLMANNPRVTGSLSALLPDSALHLLDKQFQATEVKMNIAGELSRLSSMLHIRGETFFFFFLSSFTTDVCLPVVVQVPSKLVWHHCLIPSERYVVTEMFVSSLETTGNKLFVVSSSSDFYIYNEGFVKEQTLAEFMQASHIKMSKRKLKTTVKEEPSQISLCVNWSTQNTIEILDSKESKVCSYQGVISRVLNISAGLYELDGKFGLCIAYQQMINCARGLRPGVRVEIHDAHLHHKVSEHFPSIMLCCCLGSILIVTEFSSLDAEYQSFSPNSNIYITLLFKYNLDLPNYLWLVHIVENLVQRFCPQLVTLRKMLLCYNSGVVNQFITSVMKYTGWEQTATLAREIYQEILSDSHPCPLKEMDVKRSHDTIQEEEGIPFFVKMGHLSNVKGAIPFDAVDVASNVSHPNISCQSISISELLSNAEERCWKAVKMSSLLPATEIKHLIAQQLNRKLAWSFQVLKPEDFQPQMILIGVLLVNSITGHLQLKDTSDSLDCVVQNFNKMEQTAFCETSLLDSLVQLEKYQLVVERFICSDFPSHKDLDDISFVKEKQTRIYVQFYASDAQVLGAPIASATRNKRSALIPATAAAASPAVGGAVVSGYSRACKNTDVTKPRANGSKDGPSLPKMPRLEEVALQEGHVGESKRTGCSHPLQNVSEAVDTQREKNVPGVTVATTGHSQPCREKREQTTCDPGCVTCLIFVTHKDALMLRNCQYGRTASCGHADGSAETSSKSAGTGFDLAFHVCAVRIGRPRRWACEDEIQGLPELEVDASLCSYQAQMQLIFMGKAVRWYHMVSPEGLYRLIAPKELDTSVFEQNCSSDLLKALKSSNCPLSLVVQPGWDLQYVTSISCLHDQLSKNQIHLNANIKRLDSVRPQKTSIQQVLGSSFSASLVSFNGIILLRSCNEPNWRSSFVVSSSDRKRQGVSVPGDWNLKLIVGEVGNPSGTVDIYIDLMRLSYPLGILPGAVVAFCDLERCISRSNNVYCKFLPSSSLTVLAFPSSEAQRSSSWQTKAPIDILPHLYLGNVFTRPENGLQGIAVCHVVHVWWLTLQWVCSLCGSIFQQGRCTRSSGSCPSAVGVFRANGCVIVEDGTAEARVSCRDEQVAEILAVSGEEWEELQQHVNSRGRVYYRHSGRTGNELPEYGTGDILMQYLGMLCRRTAVCRSIQLAFKLDLRNNPKAEQNETFQLRRFTCGEHQYFTKMATPLSLICLDVKKMDCQMFCDLASNKLVPI